jgi:hypothetical protein
MFVTGATLLQLSNIGARAELGRFPVENFINCKQFYILPDYILTI